MNKVALALLLSLSLTACDTVDTLQKGFEHSLAVADDLEKTIGSKPFVGFNWNNGILTSVTVTFEGLPKEKSAEEIARLVKVAIKERFKQEPKQIVLGFSIQLP